MLWRIRGQERLTVVVKATMRLVPDADAELTSPLDLLRSDLPPDGHGSLEQALETAPYLPCAGVVVRGHACAPAGQLTTALTVRVALHREGRWTLDKCLYVFGDRTREAPSPRPFQRIPIVYERAYGGPRVEENPVGVDTVGALPNIVDPADPSRPAGLGPISGRWAPRRYFLGGAAAPSTVAPEIDERLDFRYFNAAPPDQQIDFLRVDEWIFLQGVHPHLPWIRSRLPSARAVARLCRSSASGHDPQQQVVLVADTLTIDADQLVCSVIWRGHVALQPGDAIDRLYVLAGVELPGLPVRWPAPEALRSDGSNPQATAVTMPGRPSTTLVPEDTVSTVDLNRSIAPFELAPPTSEVTTPPPQIPIPGAPWSVERVAPPPWPLDLEGTVVAVGIPPRGAASPAEGPRPAPDGAPVSSRDVDAAPVSSASPVVQAAPSPPGLADAPRPEPAPEQPAPKATDVRATVLARLSAGEPLHGLRLSRVDLDDVDFGGASLERWNLAGASLVRCKFDRARLAGASLRGADLTEASFAGADLTAADLSGAKLEATRLDGASLDGADLAGTRGQNASFAGASLEGANLRQARLPDAVFDGANLTSCPARSADFSRSSFVRTNLTGANLRAAKLRGATLAGAILKGADFRDADLTGAALHDVDLASARTAGAILRDLVEGTPPDRGGSAASRETAGEKDPPEPPPD